MDPITFAFLALAVVWGVVALVVARFVYVFNRRTAQIAEGSGQHRSDLDRRVEAARHGGGNGL